MNKRTRIAEIYKNPADFLNRLITVKGWIRTVRDGKTVGFIELNDGSFFKGVQIVFEDGVLENYAEIARLGAGSAVSVCGTLVESLGAKQPFEVKAEQITIEGSSPAEYPLQNKRHSFEFLRKIAHLRPRTNTFSAVFRVRSLAAFAVHKFFNDRGFVYAHTPLITASDAEGAGEMFQITTLNMENIPKKDGAVDYSEEFFGKKVGLTVTGQFQAEAFALAFGDTYTFGPTFRADNSFTPRHAAEFWMIEPEMAFCDLEENMEIAEELLKYVIQFVLENAQEEMAFFNQWIDKELLGRLETVLKAEFARATYGDAMEILKNCGEKFEYPVGWGNDLQTEHERYLTEKHFKSPVFVTDWPKEIKAFYMRRNDDGKTVAAMDLLVPGVGELVGGSQREDRYDVLQSVISELGLDENEYGWYLDLRRFGGCAHSGFGIGFERLIMYLTGMQNIRDVCAFPRTAKNAEF